MKVPDVANQFRVYKCDCIWYKNYKTSPHLDLLLTELRIPAGSAGARLFGHHGFCSSCFLGLTTCFHSKATRRTGLFQQCMVILKRQRLQTLHRTSPGHAKVSTKSLTNRKCIYKLLSTECVLSDSRTGTNFTLKSQKDAQTLSLVIKEGR